MPSLINRSHILDLLAEKSFTRWLAGQGIDVYLLDWGAPAQDKGLSSMTDVVNGALVPALEYAAARHTQGRFHALGYCMGGTLLAAALLQTGAAISSAVFLASPWDFHAGDRILADQVRVGTPAAIQMFERSDVLPVSWIQSVFAAVNADRAMRKFSEFALMDQDSPRARLFVAVEDWLNDGVDLPRDIALSCIRGWYGENGPARREWQAGGRVVDATKIDIPALVVAAARDRLVPAESALALGDVLPRCTVMLPDCGHIGMMTGTKAQQTVWEPVRDWMCQH